MRKEIAHIVYTNKDSLGRFVFAFGKEEEISENYLLLRKSPSKEIHNRDRGAVVVAHAFTGFLIP